MKMLLRNIILALCAIIAQASNPSHQSEPKIFNTDLDKQLFFIKVYPTLPVPFMDLYASIENGRTENINENKKRGHKINDIKAVWTNIKVIKEDYMEICNNMESFLKSELENVDLLDLNEVMDEDERKNFKKSAKEVIMDEMKEWDIRKSIFADFEKLGSVGIKNKISELAKNVNIMINKLQDVCKNMPIEKCIGNASSKSYIRFFTLFKSWLIFKHMTEGPNPPKDRIPADFVRPNWKLLLNNDLSNLSLKISEIGRDMNFDSLHTTEKLDFKAAGQKMKSELDQLIAKSKKIETTKINAKNNYLADLDLRKKLLMIIFADVIYDTDYFTETKSKPCTLDDIEGRIRAIERMAEGAIRLILMKKNGTLDSVETILKMWLMSLQMFKKNGWSKNKYVPGLLPVPMDSKSSLQESVSIGNSESMINSDASVTFPIVIKKTDRNYKNNDIESNKPNSATDTSSFTDSKLSKSSVSDSISKPDRKKSFSGFWWGSN